MYKGVEFKKAEGTYVGGEVLIEQLPVRNPTVNTLSIFIKTGTVGAFTAYESVDGVDWEVIAPVSVAYGASWAVIKVPNTVVGTIVQLRCTAAATVTKVLVVQNW